MSNACRLQDKLTCNCVKLEKIFRKENMTFKLSLDSSCIPVFITHQQYKIFFFLFFCF